jgi:hypothetical protein
MSVQVFVIRADRIFSKSFPQLLDRLKKCLAPRNMSSTRGNLPSPFLSWKHIEVPDSCATGLGTE